MTSPVRASDWSPRGSCWIAW